MVDESQIRASLFVWLEKESGRNGGIFTRDQLLNGFVVDGETISLLGAKGIWIPRQFDDIPISIATYSHGPYKDSMDENFRVNYKYLGRNPDERENAGLRKAAISKTPLVYFISPIPGKYQALWPVFIIEDHPETLSVIAEVKSAYISELQGSERAGLVGEQDMRKYQYALVRQRLHQQAFRVQVLDAYSDNCTVCHLKHAELLDAAHIIPDGQPRGELVVPNGLSLCKIHHAAFDNNIIGITPD